MENTIVNLLSRDVVILHSIIIINTSVSRRVKTKLPFICAHANILYFLFSSLLLFCDRSSPMLSTWRGRVRWFTAVLYGLYLSSWTIAETKMAVDDVLHGKKPLQVELIVVSSCKVTLRMLEIRILFKCTLLYNNENQHSHRITWQNVWLVFCLLWLIIMLKMFKRIFLIHSVGKISRSSWHRFKRK